MAEMRKQQLETENAILRSFIALYAQHQGGCEMRRGLPLCNCGFNNDLLRMRDACRGTVPTAESTSPAVAAVTLSASHGR